MFLFLTGVSGCVWALFWALSMLSKVTFNVVRGGVSGVVLVVVCVRVDELDML